MKTSHLSRVLSDRLYAQTRLHMLAGWQRDRARVDAGGKGTPDPTGAIGQLINQGVRRQERELARTGGLLRMFPAANDATFGAAGVSQ